MIYEKIREPSKEEKKKILNSVTEILDKHEEVSFAYLHGSFVGDSGFRDIDIAVFLSSMPVSVLDYELDMEFALMEVAKGCPVDFRVLNSAPLSFQYNVIKNGLILLVRDDDERSEFQERTLREYFDFAPYHRNYLKEILKIET